MSKTNHSRCKKIILFLIATNISVFFLLPYYYSVKRSIGDISNRFFPSYKEKIVKKDTSWEEKNVVYTRENIGMNLPWLNNHQGKEIHNWLNSGYDKNLIEKDLADMEVLGITKTRSWCQMESISNFINGKFYLNYKYANNLDDYLNRASKHNISVICVIGDGNYDHDPIDLDGRLRWNMIKTNEGIEVYMQAYRNYITRFNTHKNILMWEINNEPYSSLTWSKAAQKSHITEEEVHTFLVIAYQTIKPLVSNVPVGFSDLQEQEQEKYNLYASAERRIRLVDDCTDIYSMHIYRAFPWQVFDFRELTTKPKWVVELGSYNYDDQNGLNHPIPANNDVYDTEKNYQAVIPVSRKLLNSGFDLLLLWSFTSNDGMVVHNPDGTHTFNKLATFFQSQLASK